MHAAMQPQACMHRPQPWPFTGCMSPGMPVPMHHSRGATQQPAMPAAALHAGYTTRGTTVSAVPVAAYPFAQPVRQVYGMQASSPMRPNISSPMVSRSMVAPAGSPKPPITMHSMAAPAGPPKVATASQSMAAPAGPPKFAKATQSMAAPAGPPMASKALTSPLALEMRCEAWQIENKPPEGAWQIENRPPEGVQSLQGIYSKSPMAKPDKVTTEPKGIPGQSPLPLRQRNKPDTGSIVRSPVSSQRPAGKESLPARSPIAPRKLNEFRDQNSEPRRRGDGEPFRELPSLRVMPRATAREVPCEALKSLGKAASAKVASTATAEAPVGSSAGAGGLEQSESQGDVAEITSAFTDVTPAAPKMQVLPAHPASFDWKMVNAHPMVTEEEKAFITESLQELNTVMERAGGLKQYVLETCSDSIEELEFTAANGLQAACLHFLEERSRNGGDTLNVLIGKGFSMGMKKVVKLEVQVQDLDMQDADDKLQLDIAILWDWDVKLEWRGPGC